MLAKSPKIINPTDKHVGSRLRMRRRLLSMSQEKLGDAVDLTFQQIQKYEKGANRIGASRMQQFAEILKVPVSFFFDGLPSTAGHVIAASDDADIPSPEMVQDFLTSRDGLEIIKTFQSIADPALRRSLVGIVRQVAASKK